MTLSLLLLAAVAAQAPRPAVDPAAVKKLEGRWELTRREHGGEKAEAKAIKAVRVTIAGATLTTRDGDEVQEEATITRLDPRAKPAAVDLTITKGTGKGDVVKGIYKLDGGGLTICVAEPGKDRPTKFAGARGTGHTLLVLQKPK